MPALEMAQETGKLLAWRKQEGDRVTKGEPLLEIETDKAVVEVEAPADGILAGVKAAEGADIPVGQTIAWIVAPGEAPPAESAVALQRRGLRRTQRPKLRKPRHLPASSPQPASSIAKISPKARRFAKELGVDLAGVRGIRARRRDSCLRCAGCGRCTQRFARKIWERRSAQFARPDHGGAHHAKLDDGPALFREPRYRRERAESISRSGCGGDRALASDPHHPHRLTGRAGGARAAEASAAERKLERGRDSPAQLCQHGDRDCGQRRRGGCSGSKCAQRQPGGDCDAAARCGGTRAGGEAASGRYRRRDLHHQQPGHVSSRSIQRDHNAATSRDSRSGSALPTAWS